MKDNVQAFIFLAEGFEEIEAVSVIDIIRRSEMKITTVSITDKNIVTGSHNVSIVADKLFSETDFSYGEILILPGGIPGSGNLNAHEGLKKLLKQYNAEGKKIAAICAAPSVLGGLHLLQGRKATIYPGFEDNLLGAIYVEDGVVKDDNIITGRGPAFALDFALSIISELKGQKKAEEIAMSILLKC